MATKVHMEALSPTMEEGQLVRWLKSEGDEVSNGDIIAEIETDKATMELVARGDGVLRKIFLEEGGTAPVGAVIAAIGGADEDVSEIEGEAVSGGGGASEAAADGASEADEAPGEVADEEDGAAAPAAAEAPEAPKKSAEAAAPDSSAARTSSGRVKASPVARRLAEEAGLDIGRIPGSGPGGRVVKRDIEEAREKGVAAPATAAQAGPEYEDVPVSQMRKTIAKRLVTSIGPVPTFYLTIDVDMGRVLEARRSVNGMLEDEGRKVSINDFVLKATAASLARHPECNAQWHDGFIRRYNAVHLGVAVAIDDGLITPVVRNAHLKGIADISEEVRELAGRARDKQLQPDEYTGATFSVSNLGMFGIHEFTAIINPPEAGILAVGGVEETPVAVDGEVVVRPRMRVTMSCDHRVIDGAQGSRYLQTLKHMLEEPAAILV
ncbi:MAG: pyruvate dehydrogenase complex dihydrolipoamide acetyltransferase [Gemmatimonadota bacterium]|nr:pyruvate dehydrogenase complex dihydrolipoamide acetyltransferase [Gemmatimonadota bacterium]